MIKDNIDKVNYGYITPWKDLSKHVSNVKDYDEPPKGHDWYLNIKDFKDGFRILRCRSCGFGITYTKPVGMSFEKWHSSGISKVEYGIDYIPSTCKEAIELKNMNEALS